MWPGWIKEIRDRVVAAIAGDSSVNVTLVGGAVGGQTVAQGNANAGGAQAWTVSGKGNEQLALEAGNLATLAGVVSSGAALTAPKLGTAVASLADVTPTASATAFLSLAAGKTGILVTCDPASSGFCRVSGGDVSATQGQPFGPGSSFTFQVDNANRLKHYLVSGTPTLCVSAV